MSTIELKGVINAAGQLEIELPEGLSPGEVRVLIQTSPFDPTAEEEFRQKVQETMREHQWLIDELAKQ